MYGAVGCIIFENSYVKKANVTYFFYWPKKSALKRSISGREGWLWDVEARSVSELLWGGTSGGAGQVWTGLPPGKPPSIPVSWGTNGMPLDPLGLVAHMVPLGWPTWVQVGGWLWQGGDWQYRAPPTIQWPQKGPYMVWIIAT